MTSNKKGLIKFDHYLQREENQWNRKTKSLFIDTILRGYIINPIIVIKEGRASAIIDGIQRLSTIRDFINDQFALSKDMDDITYYDEDENKELTINLSGLKYRNLKPEIKQTILSTELRFYEITEFTDQEIRDTFSRLNAGKPLNQKQLRKTLTTMPFQEAITDILSLDFMTPITKEEKTEEKGRKKLITPSMHRSATDRDIIVQTLMLIESSNKNYELQSFNTHAINNFISWYNDNMNDDVITQLKETIGILGNKIHSISMKNTTTPFMLYAAYKTVDNDADMDAFIKKVYDFIASYKSNTAYTDILQHRRGRSLHLGQRHAGRADPHRGHPGCAVQRRAVPGRDGPAGLWVRSLCGCSGAAAAGPPAGADRKGKHGTDGAAGLQRPAPDRAAGKGGRGRPAHRADPA